MIAIKTVAPHYFLLWCSLLLWAMPTNLLAQSEKALMNDGLKKLEERKHREALTLFEKALSANDKNSAAHYWAAVCQIFLEMPKEAVAHFAQVNEREMTAQKEFYFWKSLAYFHDGQYDQAGEFLNLHQKRNKGVRVNECAELKRNIESAKILSSNQAKGYVENLGPIVNTSAPEYSSVLSADHRRILFTTKRIDNKGGDLKGELTEDILEAFLDDNDQWSTPKRLRQLATAGHDATVQLFDNDRKLMMFRKNDLYISELEGDNFSTPKSIGKDVNSKTGRETHAAVSPDGQWLVYASDYKSKNGDLNLFLSKKMSNGEWGEGKMMVELNTDLDEDSPFFDQDGTLYFCSKGFNSIGGFDIFMTTFNKNRNAYEAPTNLGPPINSVANDIFFTKKGAIAYFTSNRAGGYGREDIYRAYLLNQVKIAGTVLNPNPQGSGPYELTFSTKLQKFSTTSSATGQYEIGVPMPISEYQVQIVQKGKVLLTTTFKPVISLKNPELIEKDFQLEGVVVQAPVDPPKEKHVDNLIDEIVNYRKEPEKAPEPVLQASNSNKPAPVDATPKQPTKSRVLIRRVYFDHDMAVIKSESFKMLDDLAQWFLANPNLRVEISGHTDSVGPEDYNLSLSERRAQAVMQYLISKNIPRERLTAFGVGESKPLVSNDDEEDGREINRRIEFKLIEE